MMILGFDKNGETLHTIHINTTKIKWQGQGFERNIEKYGKHSFGNWIMWSVKCGLICMVWYGYGTKYECKW